MLTLNCLKRLKSFAYIRKDGDRRFPCGGQFVQSEARVYSEEPVKSILIENTSVEAALEKQTLAPWDAFCVELAH